MAKLLIEEKELLPKINAALRGWKNLSAISGEFIDNLLLVREQRESLSASKNYIAAMRLATNQVLHDGLEALAEQDDTAATILRGRFVEDEKLVAIGHQLNMSEFSVSRRQRDAIMALSQIIWQRELTARQNWAKQLIDALPHPTYSKLFGVQSAQQKLVDQLLDGEAPPLVAIEGIGGVGKTALADAVVRRVIQQFQFEHIAWVYVERPKTLSGRSESPRLTFEGILNTLARKLWPQPPMNLSAEKLLEQIRFKLKETPYLVVIDNLEAESDLAYLLAQLPSLAVPSRFLLTTRVHPSSLQTAVYRHSLRELPEPDATELIYHYAESIGIDGIQEATDEHILAIYQMTGGNPLALRLVVGLLDTLPLSHILAGFLNNQVAEIESVYSRIYQQAWQTLSDNARELLQAMPLVAETGATPDYLLAISGIDENQFWPALNELRGRSLIEVRGSLLEKKYGIHRLTDSFLRNEVVFWPEEAEEE